ncbi:MAG: aminopeptidase [Tissierellales bacterium]|nr:aminopeptidase [Tissierellales bacterium]
MKSFEEKISDYAKLVVEVGINIQPNEPLVITAPVEGVEFVRKLAKVAYEKKASEVFVNWNDDVLTRLKYENAPMEVFEEFPKWRADIIEYYAKKGAGFISVHANDPNLLKGIDTEKIAVANKASSIGLKDVRKYTMNDINSWCVISIPTKNWAKSLFPDMNVEDAVAKLWDAIFKATRVDLNDPVNAWKEHLDSLERRMNYLNEKKFETLHYTASNGTDLTVKLPKNHIWAGGGGKNSKGVYFVANMPTEEVFTMPHKYGVDGVVYSSKPLNYSGNLIEDFKLVFENGKVVDFDAREGKSILEEMLNMDEGAKRLGEVALVPYSSPIEKAGFLFKNTLFDENASCHFALGKAYPTNIENGVNMSEKELDENGVNDSLIHVDFMIGTSDLSIVGKTENGEECIIFKNGEWNI